NFRNKITKDDVKNINDKLNLVFSEKVKMELIQHNIIRKDHKKFNGESSISLKYDSTGKKTGFYGLTRDVSPRIESERKYKDLSQELETILDIIPGMIFCKDKNGKITRANKSFADFLNLKKEEMIGRTSFDLFPKEQADAFQKDDLEVINTGKPKLNIEEIVDFPGKNIYSITQKLPLTNDQGDIVGLIGLAIDITDRKRAEESVKESERKYREAYDKANFYKELIAHDMNNILHTIQSSVELFELFQKNPENIKYRKNVFDIISNQVFRGATLVSNIIKLSEIEETKFPTKIIEAKRILDNSIESINRSYQGLKINIKVETNLIKIYLKANELLSDLFENLLVNAVKHNENPEIEIQIKISEEILNEIRYIKFEFVDNGIGIPDEIKQELFEKSIDRKRSKKGLGIGLSLVKQIISSFNGTIHIENRIKGDYKKGSDFIVLIPTAD
ncbi:MAG TPA: PAS domain-containing protein, partial [Candidatus Lokiarchaeia archaeon]